MSPLNTSSVLFRFQRYLPVKVAAACTVCVFIRHNRKRTLRDEMCERLIQGDQRVINDLFGKQPVDRRRSTEPTHL